jgi:trehalose-phosphatase
LERKRFSVAAHYRNVNANDVPRVERAVAEVTARRRELRRIDGKKVFELVPDIEWNKGKAVLWLLETLGLEGGNDCPIYIGDDRTDEDVFRALAQCGMGILVSEKPRHTAASYSLKNPTEVEPFLRRLVAMLT